MSPTSIRKVTAASTLLVSGLIAGGVLAGSMTANAATNPSTPTSSYSSTAARQAPDTAVTGTEADKVKAAVTAKNAGTTITEVRKDPDGSYDALGTDSSGNPVFYDVSADLKTVTAGGGGRGHGGPGGGSQDAAASSSEASSVKAAVKAKDSGATITEVRKDPDGSFDAVGTDASGNRVFYDVSADYKTVTAGGMGHGAPASAPAASTPSA